MTDNELTALAARAFGEPQDGFSPLTDDGDALRLAVKLRLSCVGYPVGYMTEEELADLKNDPYAAARRAIVRAAAEIGKDMK